MGLNVWPTKLLTLAFTPEDVIHAPSSSLVAQMVKNPPAMRETWVRSLGWEDPLEKGMATHSSILAWRIPWIHARGEGERVLALESREGTRASRRLEEGLSR